MSGGLFDMNRITAYIEVQADGVRDAAKVLLHEAVVEAEGEYKMALLDEPAHTDTGRARQAATGGEPGRFDEGNMYSAVASDVYLDGDEIVGVWGFIEDVEKYYLVQEHGLGNVPGVFGLETTHAQAVDKLGAELDRMVGKGF
jgi:hypothetical protein